MNYLKSYIKLVRKRQTEILPNKTNHKHHIFPKSIYGQNTSLVVLTPREHFVAHRLLAKAFEIRYGRKDWRTIKMGHALGRMASFKEIKLNSRMYQICCHGRLTPEIREQIGKVHKGKIVSKETRLKMSLARKGKHLTEEHKSKCGHKGNKHPQFGKPRTEETKQKIRQKAKLREPNRIKTYEILSPQNTKITITNLSKFCRENHLKFSSIYNTFKRGTKFQVWQILNFSDLVS